MLTALERGIKGNKWFSLIGQGQHRKNPSPGMGKGVVQRRGLRRGRHHGRTFRERQPKSAARRE
jgi:hypothetical protein